MTFYEYSDLGTRGRKEEFNGIRRLIGNYFLSEAGRVVKASDLQRIRFNVSNTRLQTQRRRRNIIIAVTRENIYVFSTRRAYESKKKREMDIEDEKETNGRTDGRTEIKLKTRDWADRGKRNCMVYLPVFCFHCAKKNKTQSK